MLRNSLGIVCKELRFFCMHICLMVEEKNCKTEHSVALSHRVYFRTLFSSPEPLGSEGELLIV